MKVPVVLFGLVAIAACSPVSHDDTVARFLGGHLMDCANKDFGLCLKEHALKVTERLRSTRKVSIFDGVSILNSSPKEARSLDVLPTDPQERNKLVTQRLWETTSDLLQRSELELSYAGDDEEGEESRGLKDKKEKKKKLKMLIPFILLAKAKALALIVLSIVIIAVSLAKLALFAKIAFVFKAFSIIKELLAKKAGGDDHGWAPHIEETHGHGWEGGWSRSKNEGNNLAYSAYRK